MNVHAARVHGRAWPVSTKPIRKGSRSASKFVAVIVKSRLQANRMRLPYSRSLMNPQDAGLHLLRKVVGDMIPQPAKHQGVSGCVQGSAVAAPGFTTYMVLAPMLPIMTLPSAIEVILSG